MKVGVIGLGSIGLRHARNLQALGHEVYGYDVDPGSLPHMSPERMENECDRVVIASPTDTHLDYLTQFIKAGIPVLVEKPIAHDNLLKVELLLSVAKETNVPVFVGFNLRFHSCVKQVRKWLQERFIGDPWWASFVVAQRNDRAAYRHVGVSLNWLSHEVDLALYLLGPASFISATGNDGAMVDMQIGHYSGTKTVLHGDYLAEPEMRDFRIIGEKGNIVVDLVNRGAGLETSDKRVVFEGEDNWDKNYQQEMHAFVSGGVSFDEPLATGIDGLNALRLCLAAKEAVGG